MLRPSEAGPAAGQLPAGPGLPAGPRLPAGPSQGGWRTFDRLIVVAFVAGLLLPATLMVAGLRPEAIENRPLLTPPEVSAEGVLDGSLATQVDAFLADNVVARPWAIRLRSELTWASGGTGTREVVRGRDGWLFIGRELDPLCRFPVDELLGGLGRAADAFEANGQEFRFVPAPDKHAIYPEMVTVGLRPTACSETGRAPLRTGLAALAPNAIDSWSVLNAASRSDGAVPPSLYFEQDSHWTPVGAMGVIQALVQSIDPAIWGAADIREDGSVSYEMDLAALMGLERRERVTRVVIGGADAMTRTTVALTNVDTEFDVFRLTASSDRPTVPGRTLMLYDSYFGRYVDLIAPFFADTTWVHVNDAVSNHELGAALGHFDRVIFERVERYLYVGGTEGGYADVLARFVR